MNRRRLLQIIAGLPLANGLLQRTFAAGQTAPRHLACVRPIRSGRPR